jgi:hypothetical protein
MAAKTLDENKEYDIKWTANSMYGASIDTVSSSLLAVKNGAVIETALDKKDHNYSLTFHSRDDGKSGYTCEGSEGDRHRRRGEPVTDF